jgi:hypothetical protein
MQCLLGHVRLPAFLRLSDRLSSSVYAVTAADYSSLIGYILNCCWFLDVYPETGEVWAVAERSRSFHPAPRLGLKGDHSGNNAHQRTRSGSAGTIPCSAPPPTNHGRSADPLSSGRAFGRRDRLVDLDR